MSMTSLCLHTLRANYNRKSNEQTDNHRLCLHTLRADCSGARKKSSGKAADFASTRSVQIAAAEMHRMHMHFLERVLSW